MIQQTILHNAHKDLGARMIDFGGWMMPVQYDGIVAEHNRTRNEVSIFDICHMGEFILEGPEVKEDIKRLLTTNIEPLVDGQCRYGFMLNEEAGVLDDLITYRFNENKWMIVVNAGTKENDLQWIKDHVSATTTVTDISDNCGKIDIQGPLSKAPVESVLKIDLSEIKFFRFKEVTWNNKTVIVSRTGYTGEYGVELYADNDVIVELWQLFLDAGVKPAGLGARDTLRLESGLPLYGHELDEETTPEQANLMRFVCMNNNFIGKSVLEEKIANKTGRALRGFKIEGRQAARNGHTVVVNGEVIGNVVSGSFSPTLNASIGTAFIDREKSQVENPIGIDNGRKILDATIFDLPFYKKEK